MDSSVIIAALLSKTGGSFRLLKESFANQLDLYANRYVIEEVSRVVAKKYPRLFFQLFLLLNRAKIRVLDNPSLKLVQKYAQIVDPEDAPILAGAIRSKADFLITLDRKHFLNPELQRQVSLLTITNPKYFFNLHYR